MEDTPNFKVTGLAATPNMDADALANAFRQIARATHAFGRQLVKTWKSPEFQKLLRDIKRWDREMKRRGIFPREIKPRPLSTRRMRVARRKMLTL
jgi:hypothetical protein